MFDISGVGRKLEILIDRLTGQDHTNQRQCNQQHDQEHGFHDSTSAIRSAASQVELRLTLIWISLVTVGSPGHNPALVAVNARLTSWAFLLRLCAKSVTKFVKVQSAALLRAVMDILSHGLWGGIAFGRKSRRSFWLAFAIGLAPDLLSFGILWIAVILGLADPPDFSNGTPPESTIPLYVHYLYDITHSFVVFLFTFFLIWFATRRPRWEIAAWGLHVLVDVPTHSHAFFATPVLWPLIGWKFDGWQWMTPAILIPNYVLLALLYAWFLSRSVRTDAGRAN